MNLLLDTHLLLWLAARDDMMSPKADALIKDMDNTLWFSVASLWEVTIKKSLNRPDFQTDASVLRAGLLSNDYRELAIEGRHCLALASLPPLHGDPFDRMLLAQAMGEGMQLVTVDQKLAAYEGPLIKV
ncbi:PIN domain-containing protein [Sulfitobacter sp. JBTF-M27]|uniref:PIN domain-containing protein n=1 Tax=Sulfitobacter sediminilitoris TaxID=2698830 RepID=A0A6P0CFM0_9RHOB|nr:type II toxin-antitoxin system VapC family toxin [Sulfitobacter sediminilitoris]NEK23866.1 PIN domain-containing protein [Sulfitobacter sediminilitoris]